jgi:hypothetical protein
MQLRGFKFLRRFGINGIVLWPFIIFADRDPSRLIQNHERIHWLQIQRDGVLRFYLRYCAEYLRHRRQGLPHHEAYRAISYEQEAFGFQHLSDYRPEKV